MIKQNDADKNLKEFLAKHGEEGFLKLYLANLLFELISYYLHSEEVKKNKENDPGHLMRVNYKGVPYSPNDIDKFNAAMKKECAKRASLIVSQLKESTELSALLRNPTKDKVIAASLQEVLEEILKELGK